MVESISSAALSLSNDLIWTFAPASATLAKTSTSTLAAPARSNARAQPSTVAPEVSTSSTRTSRRPATAALPSCGHAEGALDVGGALGARQTDLLGRRLDALERAGGDRHAAFRRDRGASMADWLKRRAHSRRQCSGTGTSASASARSSRPALADPAPHHRGEIEPVAIFEARGPARAKSSSKRTAARAR